MISSNATVNATVVARRLRTAWRSRHEHAELLPTGPQQDLDRDRPRVRAELSVAPCSPDVSALEPLVSSRRPVQRAA